jgi:hypothetical protein
VRSSFEEKINMATREDFLKLIWSDINLAMQEHWIENNIRASKKNPEDPFSDVGPAIERLIEAGASRRDLSLLVRHAAYEEAFNVLYLLGDPGVDEAEIEGLHEELLSADPSGLEGCPGSAPDKEE